MLEPDASGGKNWVLGATALASFMMALDGQVITTAFATIRGEFGASVETLQWTVNGYNLSFAVPWLSKAWPLSVSVGASPSSPPRHRG
jgi:MFS family permease